MMITLIIVAVVALFLLIFGGWAIATYNRLVAGREGVRAAWAQIDVLLTRRHDLIPNLVETVKGYASHERQTLEAVISARAAAVSARGDPERASAAESNLGGTLRRLLAIQEAYPDLKANANFMQLSGELASTENMIANGRSGYNQTVQQFNTSVMSFPANVLAALFGFKAQPFFELEDPAAREAPRVSFS